MEKLKCSTEDEARKIAPFRFSTIAPLVNNCHSFASQIAFFRDAATKQYTLPSGKKVYYSPKTFQAWYLDYIHYGFDALMPKTRRDLGESRKLDDITKDKIIELKQHRANRKETEGNVGATKNVLINSRFMKEIMKEKSFLQMVYIM